MLGDGIIDIPAIRRSLDTLGYSRPIDVEIFAAETWWKRDPDDVLAIVRDRFESCV